MLSAFKTYRRRLLYTYHKMDVFLLELTQLNTAKGFMVSFPNLLKILRPHKHYMVHTSVHTEKNRQSVSISEF